MSPTKQLLLSRPPVFSVGDLEAIEAAALRILDEIGIGVLDGKLREELSDRGFAERDGRILIPPRRVSDFLSAERAANGNRFSETPAEPKNLDSPITLSPSPYPQRVHDLELDQVVPFDTERLIEATKLVDVLASQGLTASPPGCPTDVPAPLQPIVQYWVAATYSREGRRPVDPKSAETIPYVMEMSEALDRPLRSIHAYVRSPLTFAGEALDCAMRFRERIEAVTISDMNSMGCTVPIGMADAFAVSTAEVVGSAILLRSLLDLPVWWAVRVCPVDLHSLHMILGSPEDFTLLLANEEVNAYLHGWEWSAAVGAFHTSAKLPGPQACVEKATIMTTGALLGARHFGLAGTLSLDEVFSAEQLLYDIEMKDHVEGMLQGVGPRCDPDRCVAEVLEGIRQGGFVGVAHTVRTHRSVYWSPSLYERQSFAAWQNAGSPTIREKARAEARDLVRQHEYELEADARRELDRILERAKRDFSA